MNKRININSFCMAYMVIFCSIMLAVCSVNLAGPLGEWDDYSLPIASILNDHNLTISEEDVIVYKQIFPNWASYIDNYALSGYMDRNGTGEMPWYFPTYSVACMPLLWLLDLLEVPKIYTFPYTNVLCLMLSLFFIFKCLKTNANKKTMLILAMSLNPIVFYISWTSAEVLIFSMIAMGMVCWYNGWYKRAAVFISIAGTLNPTIMSIGIIMIVEYLVRIIKAKESSISWNLYVKRNIPEIIRYGCCYFIGIIPMIYNYYNIGHINLTASRSAFTHGNESTLSRFLAYLFDLNFGIFPYFSVVLIVGIILFVLAIAKRHSRYIEWFLAFIIIVFLYSLMVHINCAMSGIARYNAWGMPLLLCAVILYYDEIISIKKVSNSLSVFILGGTLVAGLIIIDYNPYLAIKTSSIRMTPIAECVLDKAPNLYNPLFSTFNCRTNHRDGAYNFDEMMPIIYQNKDGYVRKILATSDNKEELLFKLKSLNGNDEWLAGQIEKLPEKPTYISLPAKYCVIKASEYVSGTELTFTAENRNADEYIPSGLGVPENWGTWTEGNKVIIHFTSTSDMARFEGTIDCVVFNGKQDVVITANNKVVTEMNDFEGGTLKYEFDNPGKGQCVDIIIDLPKAVSIVETGILGDPRTLGLGLTRMVFVEK